MSRTHDCDGRERFFLSPYRWPRWARIAFAGALPISGPLWCVAVAVCAMAVGVFTVIGVLIWLTCELVIGMFEHD